MRFLNKFLGYLEATGASNFSFKFLVDQALRAPATDWWEYVKNTVNNPQEFRQKFMQRFWDSRAQLKVKRDLEHGHFKATQMCNRSEYVMQLYNSVTMLAEPPSEAVAVECFSRHFDEQVHMAVLSQGVRTIDGLILVLDALDQAGTLNCVYSATPRTRPNSPDPSYSNKASDLSRPRVTFERPSRPNADYHRRDRSPNFQRPSNENRGYRNGNNNSFSSRPTQQINCMSDASEKMEIGTQSDQETEN